MDNSRLKTNPLADYDDLRTALLDLIEPYLRLMTPGFSGVDLGFPAATYAERAARLEGFARLLWGIVPLLAGGNAYQGLDECIQGITNGVDPRHGEFWGWPEDYDQRLVEMAVFGYALCLIPDTIWKPLGSEAKRNLSVWLSSINRKRIPDCNWVFFRILVNCGLRRVGAEGYDEAALEESFETVERFHLGNGWYNDGFPGERRARDYYIPWAMHYYGLIFARLCAEQYPKKAESYRQRACEFAGDFMYWFDAEGRALPYGRSLTYRFAQGAFWGALCFADASPLGWGEIKGLFLRNLRWWFSQAPFSETGLLSIGYAYPNQYMAERYNSPDSPLWALKAFIPLAVDKKHPFWLAEEEPLRKREETHVQEVAGLIITDSKKAGHLFAVSAGQWTPGESNEHNHMAEKYGKFAYSPYFGFNVATDLYGLDKLGIDNMLLVGEGDAFYRVRAETMDHVAADSYLSSRWFPYAWMEVLTILLPFDCWHVRFHRVRSARAFASAEGGFALPFDDSCRPDPAETKRVNENFAEATNAFGMSFLCGMMGSRGGRTIVASPNSNIIHPHTVIPALVGRHEAGEHWLGCAVMAHPNPEEGKKLSGNPPGPGAVLERLPADIARAIAG
jgi:hypothetical protein